MKFDFHWNSLTRSLFCVLLLCLSAFFVLMGVIMIASEIFSDSIQFDNSFKAGIAGLVWGLVLLVLVIRRILTKK